MNKEDQILTMLSTLNDTVTKQGAMLDTLNKTVTKQGATLDRIEQDVASLKKDVSSLKENVSSLKKDVSSLKDKTEHLESQTSENSEMLRAIRDSQETLSARVEADESNAAKLDKLERITFTHEHKFNALKEAVC